MLYYTSSYEEMKQQLEERRAAHEHEQLCAIVAEKHPHTLHVIAGLLGSHMVRVGTWLENVGHAGALISQQ